MYVMTDNYAFRVAEAQVMTHSNRYLCIATSGGLNQQRTGVIIWILCDCYSQARI